MNTEQIKYLLHNPEYVAGNDAVILKELLLEYPYFQSVRSLYLKSLYLQKSSLYNSELKITAAHTLDRDILFEFITSQEFISYKPIQLDSEEEIETQPISSLEIKQDDILPSNQQKEDITIVNQTVEQDNTDKITTEENHSQEEENSIKEIEEKLNIGKPLTFSEDEKFSYQEWLKLAQHSPIERENGTTSTEKEKKSEEEKQKKLTLIDKFIETNPKIVPTKKPLSAPVNIENSVQENNSLMTETLAKIYLEQRKYQKAIQAYEILILKYPEKSSFFADQILDIKALQQHNS
nr:tetratricopeptide repeat protein [Myroides injenensis]